MQFFIRLFIFCLFVNGSLEGIPGHLLGYHAKHGILLPRHELYSCEMTLSKCLDICGLLEPFLAAVKGDLCICGAGNLPTDGLHATCEPLLHCPGNPREFCGCENEFAYYTTEFLGQCLMSITTGRDTGANGLSVTYSKVTIQMYGDAGVCSEGSFNGNKLAAGQSVSVPSKCREIGTIERVRYGLDNILDAWNLTEAIVNVPKTSPHNLTYTFTYGNFLGRQMYLGKTYGEGYSVVDLFPNGTYEYPEQVGGPLYKPYSKPLKKVYICSVNSDCKTGDTYVQFEGLFYLKQVKLAFLYYVKKTGCFAPRIIPADVTTNMPAYNPGQQLSINSVYLFSCQNGGVFISTNTTSFNSTCSPYGVWKKPLNLECRRDCNTTAPLPDENMTSTQSSDLPNSPGTVVIYTCAAAGAVFKGTLASSVTVSCLNSGQWSVTKLPPCINTPPKPVRFMKTSSLVPFRQDG